MFNSLFKISLLFLLLNVSFLFGQSGETHEVFYTLNLVKIYFLLLLFATILNRILEYLKLLLAYLNNRWHFLSAIFDVLFKFVSGKLNSLGLDFDEQKLSENIRVYTISFLMQLLGFVLGVFLAFLLNLNVLKAVNVLPGNPQIGLFLSGLLIGAGVEPVHSFFRIAQEKRKLKKLFTELQK